MKIVVFNVGSAFSAYAECNGKKIVIDLGTGNDFSPVNDFLLPLYEKRNEVRSVQNRYYVDQLIISHPHNDHISDIENFDDNFFAQLLTTPNDKWETKDTFRDIEWDLISEPENKFVKYMREHMFVNRKAPLCTSTEGQVIAYIWPKCVHKRKDLFEESYTNNISIATYLQSSNYSIFFPGDLQKEGMSFLLDTDAGYKTYAKELVNVLEDGVDYLVAPHHGLRSSFSTDLFDLMGKTRKLNIIPEKVYNEDDNRDVDGRYQGSEYCEGDNNESTPDNMVYSHKTSVGHIFIDDNGDFMQTQDIQEILDKFD